MTRYEGVGEAVEIGNRLSLNDFHALQRQVSLIIRTRLRTS